MRHDKQQHFTSLYRNIYGLFNHKIIRVGLERTWIGKSLCHNGFLWQSWWRKQQESLGGGWELGEGGVLRFRLWCLFIVSEQSRSMRVQWEAPAEVNYLNHNPQLTSFVCLTIVGFQSHCVPPNPADLLLLLLLPELNLTVWAKQMAFDCDE